MPQTDAFDPSRSLTSLQRRVLSPTVTQEHNASSSASVASVLPTAKKVSCARGTGRTPERSPGRGQVPPGTACGQGIEDRVEDGAEGVATGVSHAEIGAAGNVGDTPTRHRRGRLDRWYSCGVV
jgi:hypothetical protein